MIEFKKTRIAFADYEGKTHNFEAPSYKDLKEVQKEIGEKPDEADVIIINALVKWGVDRDVMESLELKHIKVIFEEVIFSKKN